MPVKQVSVELGWGPAKLSGVWEPDDAERKAARELYVELVTRVAVVPLRPGEGILREALTSLYQLFGCTREILRRYGPDVARPAPAGRLRFGYLAIWVLNGVLRPTLGLWHPELQRWEAERPVDRPVADHEAAWPRAGELRADLEEARALLLEYARLLAQACDAPALIDATHEDLLVPSLVDRFNAAIRLDPDRSRAALRSLQERASRDAYLQGTAHSPLLTRPAFLTGEERDGLERDLSGLVDLLFELPELLFDGEVGILCDGSGLDSDQRAAVEATWHDREVVLSRADLLRDHEGFKAIEINIHSALGGVDSGPWHRAFMSLPVFREFIAAERLGYVDPMDGVAGALRAAATRRGLGPRPTVAVVDWPTTYPIFADRLHRTSRLIEAHGFSAFACHAGELELRDGRLVHGDRPIDILYRTFLLGDIPQAPALLEPILAAHRSGNLLLAMSFAAEMVGNKASLALLSDCVERGLFSREQQALVRRIVPWTRLTRPGRTRWRGRMLDLRELAFREQNRLVLKPVGGHAGRDVLLGWMVSQREWQAGVEQAMGGLWVLQERVRPVAELMPRIEDEPERLGFEEVDINWGVFIADGRYSGTMLRGTPSTRGGVISAENGASIGCCFCCPASPPER